MTDPFFELDSTEKISQAEKNRWNGGLSQSVVEGKEPTKRHLARKTLYAVGHKTSLLLEQSKTKGGVLKFGIETMERLVEPAKTFTASKWSTYGNPLLSKLDRTIDQAFHALESATTTQTALPPLPPARTRTGRASSAPINTPTNDDVGGLDESGSPPDEETNKALYQYYWDSLKAKFIASQWFRHCNNILMENRMVQAVTQKVYQPAEVFYNTVTEEFVATLSVEEYVGRIKTRMGMNWDERLSPLARAFYTTARAVTALVGAGRFMGGAIQLGKSKIHSAIDDLLTRWDSVLGVTDDVLDQWLPESEKKKLKADYKKRSAHLFDDENDQDDQMEEQGIFAMEEDEDDDLKEEIKEKIGGKPIPAPAKRDVLLGGSSSSLSSIRGQLTKLSELSTLPVSLLLKLTAELRNRLSEGTPSWFASVDDVLLQNDVVRTLSGLIRPADHFFKTNIEMLRSCFVKFDEFLSLLKKKLGSTWDERLVLPAKSFFSLALRLIPKLSEGGTTTTTRDPPMNPLLSPSLPPSPASPPPSELEDASVVSLSPPLQ